MGLLPVGVIYSGVLPIGIPANPTESQIQTSDVTTLNVTTGKHGFCPKLDGNAAHSLRGDGTWGGAPPEMKGMAFPAFSHYPYTDDTVHASLDALAATGANWVQLISTWYQTDQTTTTIAATGDTPHDYSIEDLTNYAHSLGLKVFLAPHLLPLSGSEALIGGAFSSGDWTAWFASYTDFIVHFATLAESIGCELFSLGNTLNTTVSHATEWRAVVAAVRAVYSGDLTYDCNLYPDSPTNPLNVQWWDAVDYIGINMYPVLTAVAEPSLGDLATGWAPLYTILDALYATWGRKIIFSEIGICSVEGAAQDPGNSGMTGDVDLTLQDTYMQAAIAPLAAHHYMTGLFWWDWSPVLAHGGVEDIDYYIKGKPAETTFTAWTA